MTGVFPRFDTKVFIDALPLGFPLHGDIILHKGVEVADRPLQSVGNHTKGRFGLQIGKVCLDIELRGGTSWYRSITPSRDAESSSQISGRSSWVNTRASKQIVGLAIDLTVPVSGAKLSQFLAEVTKAKLKAGELFQDGLSVGLFLALGQQTVKICAATRSLVLRLLLRLGLGLV
jgi:hypothetical protein